METRQDLERVKRERIVSKAEGEMIEDFILDCLIADPSLTVAECEKLWEDDWAVKTYG